MDNAGKKRKRSQYGLRDLSSMKITRLIGDGTYGMVFSAQDKETGETVALKKIKMEQETQGFPVTAIREMKILKALNHENIIALREMITYEKEDAETDGSLVNMKVQLSVGDVFMVFEFAEYDLAGLINEVTFTDDHIKSYTKQLLDGIHFMHRNRILHRDIKGANILVTVDNKIKIADLGLARSYISTENRYSMSD
jgi:cyclin-dependent kinase 12/13